MDANSEDTRYMPPLGMIEPHAGMLNVPADGQLLYKVMTVENLIRSIGGRYIHFNRVDAYRDFPDADIHDGEQLPLDRLDNAKSGFEKAPEFTAAHYYDQSRSRTYACCFALEQSDYILANYGNGSEHGKVCVVFDFVKLKADLNQRIQPGSAALMCGDLPCHQIFSINYGTVEYVDWHSFKANSPHLPNPIKYIYLKDRAKFADEREMRISLSAVGIGRFVLNDGSEMAFPDTLQMSFDYRRAIAEGTVVEIIPAQNCDHQFLVDELERLHIRPSPEPAR